MLPGVPNRCYSVLMFGLLLPLALLFVLLGLLVLAFEVWMFVDAIRNPRLSDNEKLLWCLGIIFIHPFVAIIYYFVARSGL